MYLAFFLILNFFVSKSFSFDFEDFLQNISGYNDLSFRSTSYIDISDIFVPKKDQKLYDDFNFGFSQKNWNEFIKKIETGEIKSEPKIEKPELTESTQTISTLGPQIEFLDSGTSLNVTGRKVISINYSGKRYINEQTTSLRQQSISSFDITQQLQVRMQGKVGDKITVNVDYDDTKADKQDISIVYKGDPQEVVQSISFGDIDLSLPSTEFVSYNKQLFGIRADIKTGDFRSTIIGSRTKGQTKTRQFKGNTQFKTIDIPDSSYVRRRYYSIVFSSFNAFLPIKPGTEKIYIDQQTPQPIDGILISSITADDLYSSTITYTGRFRLLTRGVDYTIDYNNGEVIFARTLNPQDVVVIDYQKSDGSWLRDENGSGRFKILKSYNDIYISTSAEYGWRSEIKTYYFIGQTNIVRDNGRGNFILKVQNLNRQDIGANLNPPQKYPDTIEVDFEQGIIKLKRPFGSDFDPNTPDPQTYSPSPITKRIIRVEYYYRINTFFLEPSIVLNSEVIIVDGKRLVKNQDYYIDYDSGFLTFYNTDKINPDSLIDIYYEVSPFGSSNQTLVGGRLSYDFSRKFSVGSTILYQSSSKQSKAPSVTDLSSNMLVYDFDLNLRDLNILGIKTSASAEIAKSQLNPNVNDNAIIDNMENSKQEDLASLDKNLWQIASNPSSPIEPTGTPAHVEAIYWDTIEVNRKDINPSSPDNLKQQVLTIDYDFSISTQVSIVYVFSKTGIDFSKKNTIELTVKGDIDNYGPLINLHFGDINEDSDGTGGVTLVCSNGRIIYNAPKTEDTNCDGVLSPQEDKGWLYSPVALGTRRFGENNGRIDTQDLDGNGKLDPGTPWIGGDFGYVSNSYFIDITSNNIQTNRIDFSNWRNLLFPLNISSTETYRWSNIKVVRITLAKDINTPQKGKISIARLAAVGNTWNVQLSSYTNETVNVYAVNNLDDPSYIPLFNAGGIVTSEYNKLYGTVREQKSSTGESNIIEQTLAIRFSSWTASSNSYVYRKFQLPIDISQHKELKFFVYSFDIKNNVDFYLKFGDQSNYFKISLPLNFLGWRMFTIKQLDLNEDGIADRWVSDDINVKISTSGNFSLQQVPQIIVGIDVFGSSTETVTVYLNDIYVSKPIKKEGTAKKLQANFDITNFASLGGKHRFVDRMFQTPVTAITNQDVEENSAYLTLSKPSFFPTSYTFLKRITNTPNVYNTGSNNLVNILQQGRVKNQDITAKGIFNPGLIPKIDLSYSQNIVQYLSSGREDEKNNYTASTSFTIPINLFLLPKNVSFSYGYTDTKVFYSYLNTMPNDYYNSREKVDTYNTKMNFNFFNSIDFSPNYLFSRSYETRRYNSKEFSYPKNMQQSVGFNSTIIISRWLRPSFNYNIVTNENSNINVTTVTLGQLSKFFNVGEIKTINRNANGNINLTINMSDIFPKLSGIRTVIINSNYQLQDGDIWNNVERGFDSKKYLLIRKRLKPQSDFAIRQNATLRDNYTTGIRFQPFDGVKFSPRFKALNSLSISSNFNYSKQDSYTNEVLTRTKNKTIPDLILSISQIEDIFSVSKWIRSTNLNLKYSNNRIEIVKNSIETNENFGIDMRFYAMNFMNTSLSYNNQTGQKKDLRINAVTSYTQKKNFSIQSTFDIKAYRFTPRFDYTNDFAKSTFGTVITNTTILAPSLLIRTDVKIPKTVKLPFMGDVNFENRVIWTTNINYTLRKSPVSIADNSRLFSLNSSAEIEASKNLRLGLNTSIQRFWHKYLKQEDYISYQLGTNIILQF